ncbi:MAG: alpha/beta fold hydrolase [Caldithrix sp.]|nr:MAG: alpha/beta fold hydrolase [Caldithrix sp.]
MVFIFNQIYCQILVDCKNCQQVIQTFLTYVFLKKCLMKLNIKKYGTDGPAVLVLHGLLGSSQNWHSAATKLSKKFQILVPDQRNHGDSPHGTHTIQRLSEDALNLLDQQNIDKIFLIGHSMGGLAAMSFSFKNPQRLKGLIVVDIAPVSQMDRMDWIFEALAAVDLSAVKQRQHAEEQLAINISSPLVRQFLLQNLKRQEDGTYAWRCNLPELHIFIQKDTGFELKESDQYEGPTLFIGGGRSEHRIAEKEELIARHFPDYQLTMIPNAGHWVHFEAMEEFITTVTDFISGKPRE